MRAPSKQAYVTQALSRINEASVPQQLYASLLHWCGSGQALCEGRIVHEHFAQNGHAWDVFLGNCAIQMYTKCGSLGEARRTFDSMPVKDRVSWNAMISANAKNGHSKEALQLFKVMGNEGVHPDAVTFVCVLVACANLKAIQTGKWIHEIIKDGCFSDDVILYTAVVNMYAKCGSLPDARRTFDELPHHRSIASWTSMISAYAHAGQPREALGLYQRMPVEPNRVTFLVVLSACSNLGDLHTGQQVHERIKSCNMLRDCSIGTTLVNMYAKCGNVDKARELFDVLPKRDVVTWTSMINAYTENMQAHKALQLCRHEEFESLEPNSVTFASLLVACSQLGDLEQGKAVHQAIRKAVLAEKLQPDIQLETSLVSMYGTCGDLQSARQVFYDMKLRNIVSWNAIIGAIAQHEPRGAFPMFQRMEQEGVRADKITFVCLLTSCASLEALENGKSIHERAKCMGLLPEAVLETALLNMYAKCHRCHEARKIFESMRHRDVVAWTAIIHSYVQEGYHREAMNMFKKMKSAGVAPNSTTFLSVIGSCSNAENLQDGLEIHAEVISSGLKTEHLENALLNMYCKCSSLQDAANFFNEMKHRSSVTYNTIMSAYIQLGHAREAIKLFNEMEVAPDHSTLTLALCACSTIGALYEGKLIHASSKLPFNQMVQNTVVDMYAKCGALEEATQVFEALQDKSLVSWTSIIVGYARHGHSGEAQELYKRMQLEGVQPDNVMFISFLIACIHSGRVLEGRNCFLAMTGDWNIRPTEDHYIFMLDLLGRGGRLDDAEELVRNMPFEPESVAWNTILGACILHKDVVRARRVAENAVSLDPGESSSLILLSNICTQEP